MLIGIGKEVKKVVQGPSGIYVAAQDGNLYYSTDAMSWTAGTVTPVNGETWYAVTYGNNKFVAVGNYISATSTDGITWTRSSDQGNWIDVAFAFGKFVKIGDAIKYSTDGATWTLAAQDDNYYSIKFINDKLITTGQSGISYSSDGVTWASNYDAYGAGAIAYGNGKYVFAGQGFIAYSSNLTSWTYSNNISGYYEDILYANGKFVAVGTGAARSTDGVSWTEFDFNNGGYFNGAEGKSIIYVNNKYISCNGDKVFSSSDAVTWTNVYPVSQNNGNFAKIYYLNGKYVVLGITTLGNPTGQIMRYSSDLITWTAQSGITSSKRVWDLASSI